MPAKGQWCMEESNVMNENAQKTVDSETVNSETQPSVEELEVEMGVLQDQRLELENQLAAIDLQSANLFKEYQILTGVKPDKRKDYNPIRNLKISVVKSFGWSEKTGKSTKDAKIRATSAALKRAKNLYCNDVSISSYLTAGTLPPDIMEYIDACAEEYEFKRYRNFEVVEPVETVEPSEVETAVAAATN